MTGNGGSTGQTGDVGVTRDGEILRLCLDRPAARNAMTPTMVETMVRELTAAASDDSLRAVHISGSGSDFCGGADWVATNSGDRQRPRTGDLTRRIPHTAHRVIELVHDIQLPVVCSVRGWAVGLGCNLALAADFTVAADDAVFWEPFIARGFSPDSGSTWLLPRLVGLARARKMLLLGDKVSGTDAENWGLIHSAVAPDELDGAADTLVRRLADGPTVALGLAKQGINHQRGTIGEAMNSELNHLELACRTGDFKEGLAAFRERRPPGFRGR
ncbi:enoyl-CoA hydratase/isomerase family protein [Gordonia hankookensis]|uniref:Enoyl-CoA hydratase/isomerase family protein n=1 Tax=Gordonia hankookensis TaxID=589403 RepID=A0ABR7WC80_9ACTN|nr:enoyl-CoA hydratase-related protein [Gordonia hankookensis]MBD1319377.1 enoyl-CoA hydratase/isomerase family protein [Gordonia hankookensis]NDZ97466.1 enoyl-CoA hydratase/isomerase family protein [Streptomyces sp. SID11726]NEB27063.1 enoyl-CoA hydratase/isomerase family protein [Streptomyces sp. SID6673]